MIVVFGGTGTVGRQIVDQLSSDGQAVRVVTRDPAKAGFGRDVEVVAGDLHDRRSLVRAVTGARAIVCTAQGGGGKGANGPRGIEGAGIPSLIAVAKDTPIEHFVYFSTASARADSPVEFFRLKFEAERTLRTSGLPFSILRPTHLTDTWVKLLADSIAKKGKATVFGSGANPVSWVAGADVARVAAALALRPGEDWSADLGGPKSLTLAEVNELIADSLGTRIKGENKMPVTMLRTMSTLVKPFNQVLARQMQMAVVLDTQPQVVELQRGLGQVRPAAVALGLAGAQPAGRHGRRLMYTVIGAFIVRRAKLVLVVSGLALLGSMVLAGGAFTKLQGGGFTPPGAEWVDRPESGRPEVRRQPQPDSGRPGQVRHGRRPRRRRRGGKPLLRPQGPSRRAQRAGRQQCGTVRPGHGEGDRRHGPIQPGRRRTGAHQAGPRRRLGIRCSCL